MYADRRRQRPHLLLRTSAALLILAMLMFGFGNPAPHLVSASSGSSLAISAAILPQDDQPTTGEDPTATDTPAPTDTPQSPPTETPIPPTDTPTPMPPTSTATDAPVPTNTPVPPDPTATPPPAAGPVALDIVSDVASTAAGQPATYRVTISNGTTAQAITLTILSEHDWPVALSNGLTNQTIPPDPDDPHRFDLGAFVPDQAGLVLIQITPPDGIASGTTDFLIITATSASNPRPLHAWTTVLDSTDLPPAATGTADSAGTATPSPTASATTTTSSLSIGGSGGSFGSVSALGRVDPTLTGITSETDAEGATYIRQSAVVLTIQADAPWTVSCALAGWDEHAGQSPLMWRVSGSDTWHTFVADGPEAICARGSAGTTVVSLDLALRVAISDPPTKLTGTIHISLNSAG